jgi:3-deoxy-D-manno-octulosonic-acid transferase
VMGSYYENFRAIVERLKAQDAVRIVQPRELRNELIALFADQAAAHALGERAYSVFSAEAGATARAVAALTEIVSGQA